ncbi:MAG: tetratricopeptide repeat protein, partial [Steroidobacteraceae bacterium]
MEPFAHRGTPWYYTSDALRPPGKERYRGPRKVRGRVRTMSKGTRTMSGSRHYPLSAIRYPLFVVLALASGLAACAPKGEELYARAEKSLDSGEVRAAIIDLKNLVKDEPENGKARALLAAALVQNGEMSAAGIEIQKARELGVASDVLLVPECRVMVARSEFDAVLGKCSPQAAQGNAKIELQVATGRALMGLGRAADAKSTFEDALAARPGSLDALLGLAGAVYAIDGLPAARAVLDRAPEAIRKQSAYWLAVGGLEMEGQDYAAAERSYSTAVERADKGNEGGERLMALGALAEAQIRQGKVKEAKVTTDELNKLAPRNPLVKQMRGQVAAAGGDFETARTLLEEAVAEMPENHQARLLLGMVNMQQGNLGQAEMHFSNVLANEPGNVRAQRMLTETRSRLTSPEESLDALQPSLAQADADPALLAMAGRMSIASGDRAQALSYLAQASARPGVEQSPEVQLEIASGFIMAGDFDSAVDLLEKMPESIVGGYQREFLLMLALLRKGEANEAIAQAKALSARAGDDPVAHNIAGAVFVAAGQRDAARKEYDAALRLKPNDPATLTNVARLDLADGKPVDAGKNFE